MKYEIGDQVVIAAARSEGKFRIVECHKRGPWWEYTLQKIGSEEIRERVSESSLASVSFVRRNR